LGYGRIFPPIKKAAISSGGTSGQVDPKLFMQTLPGQKHIVKVFENFSQKIQHRACWDALGCWDLLFKIYILTR